jgi:BetI-type transcriptional repressor, C-terminal
MADDPVGCLGVISDRYMAKGNRLRVVDLWIQALTEATDDPVIAKALRRQIREVHDFFADVIRDGQARGVVDPERDPVAEAWIFVAGGLLATMDSRLGGLLGDDLQRVRTERRRWMLAAE